MSGFRLRLALLASLLSGCGQHEATVGAESIRAESSVNAAFFTDFAEDDGLWETQLVVEGARATLGAADEAAGDGKVAELRFPGHPEFESADSVGASFATQIATKRMFHFGTFRSRLQFGSCDPTEETVSSAFSYFNDGADKDVNGLVDDLEINFQIVCGTPSLAYLTVFTDYEESASGAPAFRKLTRVVDFSTGDTFDSVSAESDELSSSGTDANLVFPDVFDSASYYELGFEWHSDSLRFFMVLGGSERTLWTLQGQESIPQQPVQMMYNLWHPETHWFPGSGVADYPASDVVMRVDWFEFVPE